MPQSIFPGIRCFLLSETSEENIVGNAFGNACRDVTNNYRKDVLESGTVKALCEEELKLSTGNCENEFIRLDGAILDNFDCWNYRFVTMNATTTLTSTI